MNLRPARIRDRAFYDPKLENPIEGERPFSLEKWPRYFIG